MCAHVASHSASGQFDASDQLDASDRRDAAAPQSQFDAAAPLLEFDSVSIAYGDALAVRGFNAVVHVGETLGIVGESGSGKSTLIRATMGLMGPQGAVVEGSIRYRGQRIVGPDAAATAGGSGDTDLRSLRGAEIGMVFQDCLASLTPTRIIGDQMLEELQAHNMPVDDARMRAIEILRDLNIADPEKLLGSYPFELSGGLGQRAGIMLALMLEPSILLADEPTSALDAASQKQTVQQLARIRRETNMALIVVSHNIGVIRAVADNIVVLKDGHMVESGKTSEVLDHPSQPYTKDLLAAVPKMPVNEVPAPQASGSEAPASQAPVAQIPTRDPLHAHEQDGELER